jgi:hypothetical protein
MPDASRLGIQIENAFSDRGYAAHRSGHTEYLLRYSTAAGISFAVGRTATSKVRLWILPNDRFRLALGRAGFSCTLNVPKPSVAGKRATGRNSNLDQIPEFKDKPLLWTEVRSPSEALAVAALLV